MRPSLLAAILTALLVSACGGGGGGGDTGGGSGGGGTGGGGTNGGNGSDTIPALTLIGGSDVPVFIGDIYSDPGATAEDAEDGDLTNAISTVSTVDTTTAGTYSVTYSVTDSDGNSASARRTVYVTDSASEHYRVSWLDNFTLPPQDGNGWSILTPSADSRIIYVSSSDGDDSTAVVYDLSNSADAGIIGSDPYHPGGTIHPYATIESALGQMRSGYPDYLLLKRGDNWSLSSILYPTYGRSTEEPAVISAYGDETNNRPLIENTGISFTVSGFIAVTSLHLSSTERNPADTGFVGYGNVDAIKGGFSGALKYDYGSILLEDCWVDWAGNAFQSYNYDDHGELTTAQNIIIRRNMFTNSYAHASHAQGLFASHLSVLLEENVFDHNGWYQQGDGSTQTYGMATQFNHNLYFSAARNSIIRNNLFLRASSMGSKFTSNSTATNTIEAWNVLLDNNFYAEGEIGISMGGNDDFSDGPRWQNIILVNNVMTALGRSLPTNRRIGWGMELRDWKSGLVQSNLMFNWDNDAVKNSYGISSLGHMTNTVIDSNVVYNLTTSVRALTFSDTDYGTFSKNAHNSNTFTNNEISARLGAAYGRLIEYSIQPNKQNFAGNYYNLDVGSNNVDWFITNGSYNYSVPDSSLNFAEFESITDDNTSVEAARDYVAPGRTIGGYLESLGYASGLDKTTEMDALVGLLKTQHKGHWDKKLSASALNDYFRAGFCINGYSNCR